MSTVSEKVHLEEFRATGIDRDLRQPKEHWRELIRDHQLLHIGFNRLKQGKEWGKWTEEDLVRYHAAVVSALRSVYFPMIPAYGGDEVEEKAEELNAN